MTLVTTHFIGDCYAKYIVDIYLREDGLFDVVSRYSAMKGIDEDAVKRHLKLYYGIDTIKNEL